MRKFLTVLFVGIVIIFCVFFQINVLNIVSLWGIVGNIGISLVIILGLCSGKFIGGLVGAVYGSILDIIISKTVGTYILMFVLLGIIAGFLNNNFSKESKMSAIMLVSVCTIIAELLTYIIYSVLGNAEFDMFRAMIIILGETLYNIFITIIIFKPVTWLGEIINKSKSSYYLL